MSAEENLVTPQNLALKECAERLYADLLRSSFVISSLKYLLYTDGIFCGKYIPSCVFSEFRVS